MQFFIVWLWLVGYVLAHSYKAKMTLLQTQFWLKEVHKVKL